MVICPNRLTSGIKDGPLLLLLYILTFEPLLQKLVMIKGIPLEMGCGRRVSSYAHDFTFLV